MMTSGIQIKKKELPFVNGDFQLKPTLYIKYIPGLTMIQRVRIDLGYIVNSFFNLV